MGGEVGDTATLTTLATVPVADCDAAAGAPESADFEQPARAITSANSATSFVHQGAPSIRVAKSQRRAHGLYGQSQRRKASKF